MKTASRDHRQQEADRAYEAILADYPSDRFPPGLRPLLRMHCLLTTYLTDLVDDERFAELAEAHSKVAQRLGLTPSKYIDRRSHQRQERGTHPELGGHAVREDK